MHLAFVDIVYDYTADRPDSDAPLGGTTSAICFLARELMKAGVTCTFFNKVEKPAEAHGIRSLPLEMLIDERSNPAYSAFIFPGRWVEWMVKSIRETTSVPLIAWAHESLLVAPLTPPLTLFDGAVFVSEWQKQINQPYTQPHWRQTVIRNGMNPRFAGLLENAPGILDSKTKPLILLYAGSTPRGAFHLPPLLDELRKRRDDFSMEIYCDCLPSRDAQSNAEYNKWIRTLPNITHVGMVGQPKLAERMKQASILVSPNPWPETSCITVMEAMAAGLNVITTNRAALPETAEGFAQHIEIEDADNPIRFDMPVPYEAFAEAIDQTMTRRLNASLETERILRVQIDHFLARYQWPLRVTPWLEYLRSFG